MLACLPLGLVYCPAEPINYKCQLLAFNCPLSASIMNLACVLNQASVHQPIRSALSSIPFLLANLLRQPWVDILACCSLCDCPAMHAGVRERLLAHSLGAVPAIRMAPAAVLARLHGHWRPPAALQCPQVLDSLPCHSAVSTEVSGAAMCSHNYLDQADSQCRDLASSLRRPSMMAELI